MGKMRFVSLISENKNSDHAQGLSSELKAGRSIGPVTVADEHLFIKKGFKYYYIAYKEAVRIFRRVRRLHANICCGDGDIEVEYLVISAGERELLEITLPGKRAAQMLIEELKSRAPYLDTNAPIKETEDKNEVAG